MTPEMFNEAPSCRLDLEPRARLPVDGVAPRNHQPLPPVHVLLDTVRPERHVLGVAVLEEDVATRARAAVHAGAVNRQVVEEEDVARRAGKRRPLLLRVSRSLLSPVGSSGPS